MTDCKMLVVAQHIRETATHICVCVFFFVHVRLCFSSYSVLFIHFSLHAYYNSIPDAAKLCVLIGPMVFSFFAVFCARSLCVSFTKYQKHKLHESAVFRLHNIRSVCCISHCNWQAGYLWKKNIFFSFRLVHISSRKFYDSFHFYDYSYNVHAIECTVQPQWIIYGYVFSWVCFKNEANKVLAAKTLNNQFPQNEKQNTAERRTRNRVFFTHFIRRAW